MNVARIILLSLLHEKIVPFARRQWPTINTKYDNKYMVKTNFVRLMINMMLNMFAHATIAHDGHAAHVRLANDKLKMFIRLDF